MEMRQLGSSDLQVSVVGLGCNNFGMRIDADATREVLYAAIDAGITFFDTAEMYAGANGSSEALMGQALEGRRNEFVLATKFGGTPYVKGTPGGTREHIVESTEESLRRLRTDHIDLLQLHYPDAATPIEETLEALDRLVKQGKVRVIGCSNFSGELLEAAEAAAKAGGWARFESAQNEWSLINRAAEADIIPACDKLGVGQLPYFPLASGMLTGKHRRGQESGKDTRLGGGGGYFAHFTSDENFDKVEALEKFATQAGHSLLELAIGWLASQSSVASVIAGATRPEQIKSNAAAGGWRLSSDELAEVDRVLSEAGG